MRTPRDRWVEEGLRVLASSGPDAVRVEVLAKALGVTKGGFYGFFADRAALLDAMLDTWERESIDEVQERVEHSLDQQFIDLGIFTRDFKLDAATGFAGQITHGFAENKNIARIALRSELSTRLK